MPIYYAYTDERGVLCIDRVEIDGIRPISLTVDDVAHLLANSYPDVIYFTI